MCMSVEVAFKAFAGALIAYAVVVEKIGFFAICVWIDKVFEITLMSKPTLIFSDFHISQVMSLFSVNALIRSILSLARVYARWIFSVTTKWIDRPFVFVDVCIPLWQPLRWLATNGIKFKRKYSIRSTRTKGKRFRFKIGMICFCACRRYWRYGHRLDCASE